MAIDLVGDLVSLGIISREQVAAADAVPDHEARTLLGKLAVAGANVDDLIAAAADIVGIPVATRDMLMRAYVVDLVPVATVPLLRERLALPVAQDPDGTIDVVVAAPEVVAQLAALGLPRCRVFLAPEHALLSLVDSVLPLRRASAFGAVDMRDDAGANAGAEPSSDAESAASSSSSSSSPSTQTRAKAEAAARVAVDAARAGASAAFTALKEHGAPAGRALLEKTTETSGKVAREVVHRARGRERTIAAAAGGVVVVIVIAVVLHSVLTRVDEVAVKQEKALAEARAKRDEGSVPWAIAGYSRVIDLRPDSPLALQALYERAVVEKNDGDVGNAAADLRMLITNPNIEPALLEKARVTQAEAKLTP